MPRLRGVLLDVDGTLVDSNDAHARAWTQALTVFGITVPFGAVRARIGMGGDKLLPEIAGIDADSPEGEAISHRRGEIFQKHFLPSLKPLPGARELLVRLKQEGLRLAVASSAKEEELDGLLRVCGADTLIEASTSSDDAESSKPDPDIIHAALQQISLPAEEVLLLGDTPYDVAAAGGAGVEVVAFRCGGWGDADLAGAIAVYDNPGDLLAHFEPSPFAHPSE